MFAMYASYTVFTSGTAIRCGCVWITESATPGFCVSRISIARACSVALGVCGCGGNATGLGGACGFVPKPSPGGGAPEPMPPPPKKEALASKISEKRNSGILELLYAESSNLRLKEEWNDALTKHQEIYNITKSTDDNNVVSSLKLVIKRLESIKTYTSEPTSYLNTLEKIDEAKWLLKETQKFSSSDTNKLNQTIIDFQSLIATYEELVLEDNKNKKDKVRATNKSQPNPSSKPNGSSSERVS